MTEGSEPSGVDRQASATGGAGGASSLVRELTGELKCAHCSYDLKGISIRDVCPECGLAVRATILAVVDPRAGELRPVVMPWVTGTALLVAPVLCLAAVVCVWVLRLSGLVPGLGGPFLELEALIPASTWLYFAAAFSTLALVRPVKGLAAVEQLRALGGFFAMVGVGFAHTQVMVRVDLSPMALTSSSLAALDPERSVWRLVLGAFGALAILGLRPNAVRLAYRSVVMRTGRVDRQPLLALVAALGVAAAGDLLAVVCAGTTGSTRDIAGWIGLVLVVVGSFLFTIGLWGIVVDTWRVRKELIRPTVGLADIMGGGENPS
ncbi:MAG: hypothetical protein AAF297_10870 [Planctomycetota bacterium]